jgi:hypothetical protein
VKFEAIVEAGADGGYVASCEDPQWHRPRLEPTNALDALRDEIPYRLELCPYAGVSDDFVELDEVSELKEPFCSTIPA